MSLTIALLQLSNSFICKSLYKVNALMKKYRDNMNGSQVMGGGGRMGVPMYIIINLFWKSLQKSGLGLK